MMGKQRVCVVDMFVAQQPQLQDDEEDEVV